MNRCAAARAPRLLEINWGNPRHPRIAIVGKGVCFDSGGLDIKTAEGMRLMKKDMGGAAHALAARQMRGFGGMLTFELWGGLPAARALLRTVRVFACAESLGGVESLIEHPAIMTHASIPADVRAALGITDNLVRLSVGIEDVDDLAADLEQALEAA